MHLIRLGGPEPVWIADSIDDFGCKKDSNVLKNTAHPSEDNR